MWAAGLGPARAGVDDYCRPRPGRERMATRGPDRRRPGSAGRAGRGALIFACAAAQARWHFGCTRDRRSGRNLRHDQVDRLLGVPRPRLRAPRDRGGARQRRSGGACPPGSWFCAQDSQQQAAPAGQARQPPLQPLPDPGRRRASAARRASRTRLRPRGAAARRRLPAAAPGHRSCGPSAPPALRVPAAARRASFRHRSRVGAQPAPRGRGHRPRHGAATRHGRRRPRSSPQAEPLLRHRDRRRFRRRPRTTRATTATRRRVTFNALFFLNPRSRAQIYLLAGFGWSGAHVSRPVRHVAATARRALRRTSAARPASASSSASSRSFALNADLRGFVRGRTDQLAAVAARVHERRRAHHEHLRRRPVHRRHDPLLLGPPARARESSPARSSIRAESLSIQVADDRTVADVLARAGRRRRAVEEGRVFVGRRRVRRGDEAVSGARWSRSRRPREATEPVRVIFQRRRPRGGRQAGGHADHRGPRGGGARARRRDGAGARRRRGAPAPDVAARPRRQRRRRLRADEGRRGAARARARAEGTYERRYVALATRAPAPASGTWDAPIGRARDPRLRAVNGRDPTAADDALPRVRDRRPAARRCSRWRPMTGRTHQIRVHASHAGAPLLGDRDYGGPARVTLPTGRVLEPRPHRPSRGARRRPGRERRAAASRGAGAARSSKSCGPRLAATPRRGSLRPRAISLTKTSAPQARGRGACATALATSRSSAARCRRWPTTEPHDRREPRPRRGRAAPAPRPTSSSPDARRPDADGRALAVGLRPALGPRRRLARGRQPARAAGAARRRRGSWAASRSSSSRARPSSSAFASTSRSSAHRSRATAAGRRRPR